jgi:hypothetical protein
VDDITGDGAPGRGERATGTPNTIYDLSSVLFHTLEGGTSYDTYIEDAEREGDRELSDFFRQVRDEDSNRADRAQQLLAERTSATATGGGRQGMASGVEATGGAARAGGLEGGSGRGSPTSGLEAGGVGGSEAPVAPRTEPLGDTISAREAGREEDKGLLERAKEAITGEEEPKRREAEGSRELRREDDSLSRRP